MEEDEKLVLKQLACDIKNLADLNYAILYNSSYNKLIGSTLKRLEKSESQIDYIIEAIERKFLLLNSNEDLLDLYKGRNKKETISEIIKRLDK